MLVEPVNKCEHVQTCGPLLVNAVCTQHYFISCSVGYENIQSTAWGGQRFGTQAYEPEV